MSLVEVDLSAPFGWQKEKNTHHQIQDISHEGNEKYLKWIRFSIEWTDWMFEACGVPCWDRKQTFWQILYFAFVCFCWLLRLRFHVHGDLWGFYRAKLKCTRILLLLLSSLRWNGIYIVFSRLWMQFRIPYHHICFSRNSSIDVNSNEHQHTYPIPGMCCVALAKTALHVSNTSVICSKFNANGVIR